MVDIADPIAPHIPQNTPIFAAASVIQQMVAQRVMSASRIHHAKGRYLPMISLIFSISIIFYFPIL
jgi:hypothetical protein